MKCSSRDFNCNRGGTINLLKVVLRFSPHQNKINFKFPLWPGIQMNTSVLLLFIFCQLVSQLELIGKLFCGVLDLAYVGERRRSSCEIALFNTEWRWSDTFFFFSFTHKKKNKNKQRPNFVIIPLWVYFKHVYTVSVLHSCFSDMGFI